MCQPYWHNVAQSTSRQEPDDETTVNKYPLYQCTPQQAKNDGTFKCLSNCDENHIAQGQYGPKKYCLNYFPNGGSCFMKPYTRTEIFSCNGKAGGTNPPMWVILVGGSNMFMMVKTLIDKMLNLAGTAGYNPASYWGAQSTWYWRTCCRLLLPTSDIGGVDYATLCQTIDETFRAFMCCTVHTSDGKPPYGEAALMDFIWDGSHNLVHKTTWWWDGMPSTQPSTTQVRMCGV
jgi:hypothetical protein